MRYAIQNATGLLFTGNDVPEAVEVIVKVPNGASQIGVRSFLAPHFRSIDAVQAIKYDDIDSARSMLTHPDLKDPAAFGGCSVVEVEFERDNLGAVRAVPSP